MVELLQQPWHYELSQWKVLLPLAFDMAFMSAYYLILAL